MSHHTWTVLDTSDLGSLVISVSDYDYSEFGAWDADSSSFYCDYSPPYRPQVLPQLARRTNPLPPLPPSSPPRNTSSPVGLNVALSPLAQVLEQVGSRQGTPVISSPVARTPTPELRYPSPAPLPLSPPTIRLVSPVFRAPSVTPGPLSPRPASAVGFLRITTPDLHPLSPPSPPPRPATPDSPIDYEAAALRIEQRVPTPVIPDLLDDQENRPPALVIRPPPCIGAEVEGVHPHQYVLVPTPRGEELRIAEEVGPTYFNHLPFTANLQSRPPRFTGVIPFRHTLPHYETIYPPAPSSCYRAWHPAPVRLLKGDPRLPQ